MKSRKKILVIISLLGICLVQQSKIIYAQTQQTDSAIVSFESAAPPAVNQESDVIVALKSAQPLNAYAIAIQYPKDDVELVALDNSRSIIDVWQQQPSATNDTISFQGGSFEPFQGDGGEFMRIRIKPKKRGDLSFSFSSCALSKADGRGTPISCAAQSLTLTVQSESITPSPLSEEKKNDVNEPEIKTISLIKDPFSDSKLISFLVSDKETGVSNVQMRVRSPLAWSEWMPVQNPAEVPKWAWMIDFAVTDNAHNRAEIVLYDWQVLGNIIAIACGILFAGWIGLAIRKKIKKQFAS